MHRRPLARAALGAGWVVAGAVLAVIALALAGLTAQTLAPRADAAYSPLASADLRGDPLPPFDAGDLISDAVFFDPDAMSAGEVQDWLLAMPCAPTDSSPCLAFFRQATRDVPADGNCAAYVGGAEQTAAAIVAGVAHACGVNPRVLLVLVQKEQSLVTAPSASGYRRATGYACPDTAPCDTRYDGFFNQLYRAAWQFREYTHPEDHWRYRVGRVAVQFSPDASCGSAVVDIANQATAGLYDYTPYQPDRHVVTHPSATDDPCGSHGNLNFFRLYNAWFGDSRAEPFPRWWGACLDHLGGADCLPRGTTP